MVLLIFLKNFSKTNKKYSNKNKAHIIPLNVDTDGESLVN